MLEPDLGCSIGIDGPLLRYGKQQGWQIRSRASVQSVVVQSLPLLDCSLNMAASDQDDFLWVRFHLEHPLLCAFVTQDAWSSFGEPDASRIGTMEDLTGSLHSSLTRLGPIPMMPVLRAQGWFPESCAGGANCNLVHSHPKAKCTS